MSRKKLEIITRLLLVCIGGFYIIENLTTIGQVFETFGDNGLTRLIKTFLNIIFYGYFVFHGVIYKKKRSGNLVCLLIIMTFLVLSLPNIITISSLVLIILGVVLIKSLTK